MVSNWAATSPERAAVGSFWTRRGGETMNRWGQNSGQTVDRWSTWEYWWKRATKHHVLSPTLKSRAPESQRMTDWVHNGSAENSNQSQLNLANDDPSAYSSVPSTPMSTSFLVNPEAVNLGNVFFDNLTRDPRLLFQQKSCAEVSSIRMPVVAAGLNDTAFAPPTFESSQVNPRTLSKSAYRIPFKPYPHTYFHPHNR